LFHSAVPHTFAKRFKKDLLRVGADIVLLGHTHIPMEAVFRGIHVYNPGSVCRRKTRDSHTCAVLSLPDKSFEVYDIGTGERVYDILRISC
jgi:predicted phosphodiesterase